MTYPGKTILSDSVYHELSHWLLINDLEIGERDKQELVRFIHKVHPEPIGNDDCDCHENCDECDEQYEAGRKSGYRRGRADRVNERLEHISSEELVLLLLKKGYTITKTK